MLRPQSYHNSAHRRSFICQRWELRITARCMQEDLELPVEAQFAAAAQHPIVKALIRDRTPQSHGTRQVSPIDCDGREIWVLANGHEHRGATWHDETNEVIWLCAYCHHRSGAMDDAFPYFRRLAEEERLIPVVSDYTALAEDENYRFADAILREGPELVRLARATPGQEHRGRIARTLRVTAYVEVVDDVEAVTVVISTAGLVVGDYNKITPLLAAMGLGPPQTWESASEIAGREIGVDEIGFTFIGPAPATS